VLEDVIFDVLDDDEASSKAKERANQAEDWLSNTEIDRITVQEMERKAQWIRSG